MLNCKYAIQLLWNQYKTSANIVWLQRLNSSLTKSLTHKMEGLQVV